MRSTVLRNVAAGVSNPPESAARPMTTTGSPDAASARTKKVAGDRRWAESACVLRARLKTAWLCTCAQEEELNPLRSCCEMHSARLRLYAVTGLRMRDSSRGCAAASIATMVLCCAPCAPGGRGCCTGLWARPGRPVPCDTIDAALFEH